MNAPCIPQDRYDLLKAFAPPDVVPWSPSSSQSKKILHL